jgi:RHS repeat-associated protein
VRAATVGGQSYWFDYDADGNLSSKYGTALQQQTLTWNALGQLVSVVGGGPTTWQLTYDGFGRRVSKTMNGVTKRYLYDGDNLFMELDNGGAPVVEYAYWGLDNPHSMKKGGQTYYFVQDPVGGSVKGLVRQSDNSVQAQYGYTMFGYPEGTTIDNVGNTLQFAGREFDETGLYYNRARYYDPLLGRFISEDPIGLEGGINLYAYASNDPVQFRDPLGLSSCGADGPFIPGEITLRGPSCALQERHQWPPRAPERVGPTDPGGGPGPLDRDPGREAERACQIQIGLLSGTAFLEFVGLGPTYVAARAAIRASRHARRELRLASTVYSIPWSSGIRQGNAAAKRAAVREFGRDYGKGVAASYSFTYGYQEYFELGQNLLGYLPLPLVGLGFAANDVYQTCWHP